MEDGDKKKENNNKKMIEVACPNCGGVTQVSKDKFPIYTCHIGHKFTERSFEASFAEYTEGKLWEAYRTLMESKTFHEMCYHRAVHNKDRERASSCKTQAERLNAHAEELRNLINQIILDSAELQH